MVVMISVALFVLVLLVAYLFLREPIHAGRRAIPKLSRLYHQVGSSIGTQSTYHNIIFRLDPELAFELRHRRP